MKKNIDILRKTVTILVFFLGFSPMSLSAQTDRLITGSITDEQGAPIIGVSIVEKGTTNGTTTNVNGDYQIKLKTAHAILTYSCLGFNSQETTVGNSAAIPVVMSVASNTLKEVVVTGYGHTVSRDKLTAAISKVSAETLEKGVHSNPVTALSGAVSGVRVTQTSGQPGTAPSIQIRGGASLNGGGGPLYIVDGVQKTNLADINSNDIESIEILKDAAATALYGARANNGVVLVTSKSGKRGRSEVTFKANVGRNYMNAANDFLNAEEFLYWARTGAVRSGMTSLLTGVNPYGTGNILESDGNKVATGIWSTMYRTAVSDDKWTELQSQGWRMIQDPVWDGVDAAKQNLIFKEFSSAKASLQEAWSQDYTISMSGGNDKGKYYSSIGYYKEDGFPLQSYYSRLSFNFSGEYKVKSWITSSAFVNFSNSNVKGNPNTTELNFFGRMFSVPPTIREYNNNGELIAIAANNQDGNLAAQIDNYYRRDEMFRTTIGPSLKFDITKDLYLKLNAIWYLTLNETEDFNKAFLKTPNVYDTARAASASEGRGLNQTYNAILGYSSKFGKSSVSAVGGVEFIDKFNYGLNASGNGATSDDFINLQYTNAIVETAGGSTTRKMSTTHVQERILSTFINTNYDYDNRYLLSFSGRLDGYSKLGDNKYGFFPGVSVGWNLNNEKFMSAYSSWIDNLKIRVGYGQNGNVSALGGAYDLQGAYTNSGNYKGEYGFLIGKLPYRNLRWEKTTSVDVGIDFSLFQKLRGTVGAFNKSTTDLLATASFPTSAGFASMLTNNGSVRTRGLEAELRYYVLNKKDFKWDLGLNITYQRSKILTLPDNGIDRNRQNGQQVWDPKKPGEKIWVGGYQEGQEYGDIYTYKAVEIIRDEAALQKYAKYVDKIPTKPVYGPEAYAQLSPADKAKAQQLAPGDMVWQDVNGDDIIDTYDQVKVGNLIPKVMGGFNTTFSWKSLTLYAHFDYAMGYKQLNERLAWYLGMKQGHYNTIKDVRNTWSETNRDAKYPIFQYADQNYKQNYRLSSVFYENSSYLCAREISLTYDMPSKWMQHLNVAKLSFSVSGQNLFYLTKSNLYTPEYGGDKNGGYPMPKSVFFGAKLTF